MVACGPQFRLVALSVKPVRPGLLVETPDKLAKLV
jgi:hypothetical protein